MKIAIASGKGGTGKTFVSTNLYDTFSRMGLSTGLIDCDAEAPNSFLFFTSKKVKEVPVVEYRPILDLSKCVFCGKCAEYCHYNALLFVGKIKKLKFLESLCHGCGACSFACDFSAIEDSYATIGKITFYEPDRKENILLETQIIPGVSSPVPVIKEAFKLISEESIEYLLLDSPPGTSCPFIQTVVHADYVVLVTEPTPFGLSDLKQAVNTLRVLNKKIGVVLNRSDIGDKAVYDYLAKESIPLLAEIPFEKEIAQLYSNGKIAVQKMKTLQVVFENLAQTIINHGNSCN